MLHTDFVSPVSFSQLTTWLHPILIAEYHQTRTLLDSRGVLRLRKANLNHPMYLAERRYKTRPLGFLQKLEFICNAGHIVVCMAAQHIDASYVDVGYRPGPVSLEAPHRDRFLGRLGPFRNHKIRW